MCESRSDFLTGDFSDPIFTVDDESVPVPLIPGPAVLNLLWEIFTRADSIWIPFSIVDSVPVQVQPTSKLSPLQFCYGNFSREMNSISFPFFHS